MDFQDFSKMETLSAYEFSPPRPAFTLREKLGTAGLGRGEVVLHALIDASLFFQEYLSERVNLLAFILLTTSRWVYFLALCGPEETRKEHLDMQAMLAVNFG
jgi:hypothetical protein